MTGTVIPIEVEINLRIPNVKDPSRDAAGYPIANADVRFIRVVSLAVLPKEGSTLDLQTSHGIVLRCDVARAEWNDRTNRFTVYCHYAQRSMPREEYEALLRDPEWVKRPLL